MFFKQEGALTCLKITKKNLISNLVEMVNLVIEFSYLH